MAKRQSPKSGNTNVKHAARLSNPAVPSHEIPAAELMSFLKEARGVQTWTEKELAKALNIGLPQAQGAVAVLQLQGYIEPAGHTGKWRVTQQGDLVSGAKPPRFTRQTIEDALLGLRDRIKAANEDRNARYRITEAVAFGDFLSDRGRVQAADVGVRLIPKEDGESIASVKEHAAELDFLKQLRGKAPVLHVVPYEDWMSSRSHKRLL